MGTENKKPRSQYQPGQSQPAVAERPNDPGWAWTAYEPDAHRPWNLAQAGHLYRRAAFGAAWGQLQESLREGPQRTVDKLLRPQADIAAFNHIYDEYESSAEGSAEGLRAWWLRRIIQTPHPLLEKMTLFWHSHFATNGAEVKDARLMRQHVQLLRSSAMNSFRGLLQGISRDPAVLIWLGADANRKAVPNENFARQLMETFALGPGHYTEEDVREAAKAFTGWFVLRGQLRYIVREHDATVKRILGQEGNFTGDDVVRMVLEQPAVSWMLVHKLYRWLISETEEPDPKLIRPLAESFGKDYNIMRLVETILRSNLFFSMTAYRQRIKCPVEFALGIVKGMEGTVSTTQLGQDLAALGQNLYHPPTVKGWTGGRHWINSATLVGRNNLALSLLGGSGAYAGKLNPWAVAKKHGFTTAKSAAGFLLELFLQGDLDSGGYDHMLKTAQSPVGGDNSDLETKVRGFAHTVVTLAEFHLA
jgi:uncharacterized protein (DUF1800 family)